MTTDVPKFRDLMRPEIPYGPHLRPQTNTQSVDGQHFEEFLKRTESVVRPTPSVDPSPARDLPQRADRTDQPRQQTRDDSRLDRQDRQDRMDRRSDERSDNQRSDSQRADDRRSKPVDDRRSSRAEDRRADNDRSETGKANTDRADTDAKAGDAAVSEDADVVDDTAVSEDGLTSEVDGEQAAAESEAMIEQVAASLADDVLDLATTLGVELYETGGDAESVATEQASSLSDLDESASEAEVLVDQDSISEETYDQVVANVAVPVAGLMTDEELTLDDEITIDADGVAVDAEGAGTTGETQSQAGDEVEVESATETGDETSADNSGEQAAGGGDDQTDEMQVVEESGDMSSAQDGGEVPVPLATRTARVESSGAQATTSSSNTSNPVVRIDGVQATSTDRGASITAPVQSADAGIVDGNADDPLWMQVRRAMNSLRTLENGDQQINLRLRPAELGSIMVRVAAGENQTTVSLIADSNLAASQLSQQRQLLVEELERQGMLGVSVDVGTGSGAEQRSAGTSADEQDSSGGGASSGTTAGNNALSRSIDELIGASGTRRSGVGSGSLIDLDL